MTSIVRGMLFACACAGIVAAATPALAQTVVIGPYPYVGRYGAYAGPYGAYVGAYGPYVVPYGGYGYSYHRFGFDPDPNVRMEISRTRNWRKG
jgi:hypothetical protein